MEKKLVWLYEEQSRIIDKFWGINGTNFLLSGSVYNNTIYRISLSPKFLACFIPDAKDIYFQLFMGNKYKYRSNGIIKIQKNLNTLISFFSFTTHF